MELKDCIEKMRELKATASIEAGESDPRVRNGVEAQVRNAKRELEEMEVAYKQAVLNHIVIVGVKGANAQEFANIAKYAHKTLAANYDLFEERVFDWLKKRGARNEFSNNEYFMFLELLAQVKVEFNVLSLPQPNLMNLSFQAQGANTYTVIRELMLRSFGHQLSSLALAKEISGQALKAEFSGKLLPVVVFSQEKDIVFDQQFLRDPVCTYDVNAEQTEDTVKNTLEDVKKLLGKASKGVVESNETETIVESQPKTEPTKKANSKKKETV